MEIRTRNQKRNLNNKIRMVILTRIRKEIKTIKLEWLY